MLLLIGALTIGLILSLLAMGVFVSFRIFEFADITADGSITLGGALCAVLIVGGMHPVPATAVACAAGAAAGAVTGLIHTRFAINRLLSGILVMTALYSVNLHIMGKSNVPLLDERTAASIAETWGLAVLGRPTLDLWGWTVNTRDLSVLVLMAVVVGVVAAALYAFFRTNLGTAMQASGDNAQMMRALGVNVDNMIVLGLALSNALVALAGALLTQYQGFADAQMGIGMIVWGLASIIIGEALVGVRKLGFIIVGAVMGSVLFRLLVAIALRAGLNPNDLKLVTAVFVFAALVVPTLAARLKRRRAGLAAAVPASGPGSGAC